LAVIVGILIVVLLYPLLKSYNLAQTPRSVGFADAGTGSVRNVGEVLFSEYLVPFEVTSVLILVAIIGAVVLAKRKL
jgi:NADH-quinone oxidoreductase subunit J